MKSTVISVFLILATMVLYSQQVIVPKFDQPQKLGAEINSTAEETTPILSPDEKTLYFVRTFHDQNVGGKKAGQDIWYSTGSGTNWSSATNYTLLNTKNNNGVVGVSSDGKTLYLLNLYSGAGKPGVSFVSTTSAEGTKPESLGLPDLKLTGDFYGFYMNPENDTIIISANLKTGSGEEDLYVCIRKKGVWQEPINLGTMINTTGFEISPFLDKDGKTLYFSSNGRGGAGGADIFMTKRLDETWTKWSSPKNLGKPINSKDFDAYFVLYNGTAYFSSSRGGKDADIYSAKMLSEGAVGSTVVGTNLPSTVKLYFSMNEYMLGAEEKKQLDEIASLMTKDSKLKITVSGYTCDIGDNQKNDKLSAQRANSVLTYLMIKGIEEYRITVRHFGEVESKTENDIDKELNRRVDIFFSY